MNDARKGLLTRKMVLVGASVLIAGVVIYPLWEQAQSGRDAERREVDQDVEPGDKVRTSPSDPVPEVADGGTQVLPSARAQEPTRAAPTPCTLKPSWRCLPPQMQMRVDKENWGKDGIDERALVREREDGAPVQRLLEDAAQRASCGQCVLRGVYEADVFQSDVEQRLATFALQCMGAGALELFPVHISGDSLHSQSIDGTSLFTSCRLRLLSPEVYVTDAHHFVEGTNNLMAFRPQIPVHDVVRFELWCTGRPQHLFAVPDEEEGTDALGIDWHAKVPLDGVVFMGDEGACRAEWKKGN